MTTVNQVFESAPMGRRVVLATALSAAAFIFGIGINLYFTVPKMGPQMPVGKKMAVIVAPVFSALVGVVVFMQQRSKVARFKIEENVLVLGKKKFSLEGATEVSRDSDLLKAARRCVGNGGLGAITGSFKSKKLGKFEVFMSGTENAVVVRWPDRAVAVSPADPEFFILSAQKAAGLR
jgi:hypothetical protein